MATQRKEVVTASPACPGRANGLLRGEDIGSFGSDAA